MNQIRGELLSLSQVSNSDSIFFFKTLESLSSQSPIIKGLTVIRKQWQTSHSLWRKGRLSFESINPLHEMDERRE